MENQRYSINVDLTSIKMKHSDLLVSLILHFINENYRKIKGKKRKIKK